MMGKNNSSIFIIYKIFFIILCSAGILLSLGIVEKSIKLAKFNYYTVLSNVVCLVYMILSLIYNIVRLNKNEQVKTFLPRLKGAVVLCIIITFMIFNFVLLPQNFSMDKKDLFFSGSNLLLHYVTPIMMVIDWLLFDKKRQWRKVDPLIWLSFPVAYFTFVTIRGKFGDIISGTYSKYPYPFMDADVLGTGNFIGVFFILAAAFLILGYSLYFIDNRIGKKVELYVIPYNM